jgi:hypothetical protein
MNVARGSRLFEVLAIKGNFGEELHFPPTQAQLQVNVQVVFAEKNSRPADNWKTKSFECSFSTR